MSRKRRPAAMPEDIFALTDPEVVRGQLEAAREAIDLLDAEVDRHLPGSDERERVKLRRAVQIDRALALMRRLQQLRPNGE